MKALIDGDIIVYRAGFGSQETITHDDGDKEVIAQPVAFALSNTKKIIQSILTNTGASDFKIYLTADNDKTNFRKSIATIKPYKGNRKAARPLHYAAIRNYLVNRWKAEVITGEEADDALGINQDSTSIICSIDKDLRMIPGNHYHMVSQHKDVILDKAAMRNFYLQLLVGDTVDNIPGCPMIGKIKAAKLLPEDYENEYQLFRICVAAYLHAYTKGKRDVDYQEEEKKVISIMTEIGRLLWIRRKPGEMWEPPKPEVSQRFIEKLNKVKENDKNRVQTMGDG